MLVNIHCSKSSGFSAHSVFLESTMQDTKISLQLTPWGRSLLCLNPFAFVTAESTSTANVALLIRKEDCIKGEVVG